MPDSHRLKIQNSNILNALIEHVTGEREMSASQVTAGLGLLRKVLPDLTQVDSKAEVVHKYVARAPTPAKTVDEWMDRVKPNGKAKVPAQSLQ